MKTLSASAVAEDNLAASQRNASEFDGDYATDDELDSMGSSCSTYSYDPRDFPRACEIEEFMSPSFQWPASSSASFASSSSITSNIQRRTSADHPSGDEWMLLPLPAHLVRFSSRELQVAVKKLGDNVLGHTSTGKIYAGRLSDGSLVAVKRVERTAHQIQFQTELESSLAIPHPNLMFLIGFCVTPFEGLLVYPYTAKGNLAGFLVIVALLCTQASPVDRPTMSVVVKMLEAVGPVERWADRLQFIMERHQTEVELSRNRTDIL